jgi:hypothetical protein
VQSRSRGNGAVVCGDAGAEVIRTPQPDSATRVDLNLGGGQKTFIAPANPKLTTASPLPVPYYGLEHIGLMTVTDMVFSLLAFRK